MSLDNNNLLVTSGWINGQEITAKRLFSVVDPATCGEIAQVSDLGAKHALAAIDAATDALVTWRTIASDERRRLILKWAALIEQNIQNLSEIVSSESGKPLREAAGEINQCAALLRWFAQVSENLVSETLAAPNPSQRNYTIKQPIGVVACITPWNFPAAAVIVKAGAAIITGCTTVVKPSEETPLVALAFAQLAKQAGILDGVFNVLPCKDPVDVSQEFCRSEDVRMLSFTGSIPVGKELYAACGDTVKRLALELGGNAPFIVFDDAHLEDALDGAMGARFYNSGQICVGANRFLIQRNIYQEFAEKFAARVVTLKVGNGFDENTNIGPMINHSALKRLQSLVNTALSKGAEVIIGGSQDENTTLFFQPTVLTEMSPKMDAFHTEIFGPVACLYSFENEAEALHLANATSTGLAAYVYSSDQERLSRFSESLEAGVLGINSANIFANDLPFGGIKQSGLGREHGMQCLEEYVETKSICMGL